MSGIGNTSNISRGVDRQNQQTDICRYFLNGCCRYGEFCRFLHTLDQSSNSSTPLEGAQTRSSNTVFTNNSIANSNNNTSIVKPSSSSAAVVPLIIPTDPSSWVMAPIFVPQINFRGDITAGGSGGLSDAKQLKLSYAQTVGTNDPNGNQNLVDCVADSNNLRNPNLNMTLEVTGGGHSILCPYIKVGDKCRYGALCVYEHGELCELCSRFCLHPTDKEQQKQHINECIRQHEKDMELSFAIARSKDKTCGVCFEIIMEKSDREQRFGILPNCNHVFCLQCIRKWRQAKQFETKIIRACPECRVTSDFVCPSSYWVDTKEEKDKLIDEYKSALGEKDCKYYKQGGGKCPFGNKCFYKHALPNGTKVDVGVPQRVRRYNAMGDPDVFQGIFLWDFISDRNHEWFDEIVSLMTDSDESDISDYDNFS